jgi:hypothetical protein
MAPDKTGTQRLSYALPARVQVGHGTGTGVHFFRTVVQAHRRIINIRTWRGEQAQTRSMLSVVAGKCHHGAARIELDYYLYSVVC